MDNILALKLVWHPFFGSWYADTRIYVAFTCSTFYQIVEGGAKFKSH